jgi:hypothetical protein
MTQPTQSNRIHLDVGNGRIITMDVPPPDVQAAMSRLEAARAAGDDPLAHAADAALLFGWLDAQEQRYPTAGTWMGP